MTVNTALPLSIAVTLSLSLSSNRSFLHLPVPTYRAFFPSSLSPRCDLFIHFFILSFVVLVNLNHTMPWNLWLLSEYVLFCSPHILFSTLLHKLQKQFVNPFIFMADFSNFAPPFSLKASIKAQLHFVSSMLASQCYFHTHSLITKVKFFYS